MEGVFAFEGMGDDLDLVPLAARRALDVAGIKVSLAGWRALPLEVRRRLVREGTSAQVAPEVVRALASGATPPPAPLAPLDEATLEPCDEDAQRLLGAKRPLAEHWRGLPPLRRFALRHLARRGDAERIARAYDELVAPALTHLDAKGQAHMVDVGEKAAAHRVAIATASVRMSPSTAALVAAHGGPKGDVLATARIAGLLAAKRTSELIPLCHPIALTRVSVELDVDVEAGLVRVNARAETRDRTGVEMEALTAASIAALTVYDMVKGVERGATIEHVVLTEKSGGRSGAYRRGETP
ncbi:MAG: cyclic pyranopterin monophosphate synthase MoaC [Deltaproteobacteria bacterium]|nr:cyclic pyranopterin monophosphate synthase MoaC [Deltaproteobacteria bacterium]